jgi:putative ABC transport system ATP-binding protein
VVVGIAIDLAIGTGDQSALAVWLAAIVGVFVVLASCGFGGYWLMTRAFLRAGRALRLRVADRVLDERGGVPGQAGSLVSLASSDANRAGSITEGVAGLAGALAALIAGGSVLFIASPVLALVVLVGASTVLLISRMLAKLLVGRAEVEQQRLAEAIGSATDLVTGLRVLKGIGAELPAAERYRTVSQAALAARLHAARLEGGYFAGTGMLTGTFLVVVAWVGGRLALSGTISVGELVAAVGLAQFLVEPLERLTMLGPLVAGARAAAGRLGSVFAAPAAVGSGVEPMPANSTGLLHVRHRDLFVEIAAGEHLGLVAVDPSDAETVLDVLARDAEPDGALLLDGTDLRTTTLDAARRAVMVARHDAVLFDGTLADNLTPADSYDGERNLRVVLAATAADEVVDNLPGGLAGVVDERGRTLSGGQRQRVALARALATETAVLVLHDPTTAIDAVTEARIAAGVTRHRAGRTTLLVTSSPTLLAHCDRVVLVVEGRVVAVGTHHTLVGDERYRAAVLA